MAQKKKRNDEVRQDYKRPPSFLHLAPALESIEKQQSELVSQYESALKHSKNRGRDFALDKLAMMRSVNRLSNNSVKTLPSRNMRSPGSNAQSELDRAQQSASLSNLPRAPGGLSSLPSRQAIKSSLNVDTSKDAYQTQDPLIRGGAGTTAKHQIPTYSNRNVSSTIKVHKPPQKDPQIIAKASVQNSVVFASEPSVLLKEEEYLDADADAK